MNDRDCKRIDGIMDDIEKRNTLKEHIQKFIEGANAALTQYREAFDGIATEIEEMRDEYQEKYDNLSEKAQGGEKGDAYTDIVNALDQALAEAQACTELEDFVFEYNEQEVIRSLDEAKGAQ